MNEIERMMQGRVLPGSRIDLQTDLELHKLNTEFKVVNFGQDINEQTI